MKKNGITRCDIVYIPQIVTMCWISTIFSLELFPSLTSTWEVLHPSHS